MESTSKLECHMLANFVKSPKLGKKGWWSKLAEIPVASVVHEPQALYQTPYRWRMYIILILDVLVLIEI
jgi:hypothetical protein